MALGDFVSIKAVCSLVEEDGRNFEDARLAAGRGPTRQVKIHLGEEERYGKRIRGHGNAVVQAFGV